MSEVTRIDLGGVNSYLLRDERPSGTHRTRWVLVDTGGHLAADPTPSDRRDQLLDGLAAAGCRPGDLALILLTHGHNDHAANAAYVRERFGAPIAMHAADVALVERPTLETWLQAHHYQDPGLRQMYAQYAEVIAAVTRQALAGFTPYTPDLLVADGFELGAYGIDARVIHVPGHTGGSLAVLTTAGALIAGDTYANLGQPGLAPNADDFAQMAASAAHLRAYRIARIYPGHGEPFDGPGWRAGW